MKADHPHIARKPRALTPSHRRASHLQLANTSKGSLQRTVSFQLTPGQQAQQDKAPTPSIASPKGNQAGANHAKVPVERLKAKRGAGSALRAAMAVARARVVQHSAELEEAEAKKKEG